MTQPTNLKPARRRTRQYHTVVTLDAPTPGESGRVPSVFAKTKLGKVMELLQREKGATLEDLVEATNWQRHTARAFLSGLRKKGHAIIRVQIGGGINVYSLYIPPPQVPALPPIAGHTAVSESEVH